MPADIILVTHGHNDHNKVELVAQKKNCVVITNDEAQDQKCCYFALVQDVQGCGIIFLSRNCKTKPKSI